MRLAPLLPRGDKSRQTDTTRSPNSPTHSDPDLDNSFKINKGLRIARQLLIDITSTGMPVGCELLDTISSVPRMHWVCSLSGRG